MTEDSLSHPTIKIIVLAVLRQTSDRRVAGVHSISRHTPKAKPIVDPTASLKSLPSPYSCSHNFLSAHERKGFLRGDLDALEAVRALVEAVVSRARGVLLRGPELPNSVVAYPEAELPDRPSFGHDTEGVVKEVLLALLATPLAPSKSKASVAAPPGSPRALSAFHRASCSHAWFENRLW